MKYACIRDCSICPFRCFDVSRRVFRNIEKTISSISTPKTQKSEENNNIKPYFEENTQKLSNFESKTEILNENIEKSDENKKMTETKNLPTISEIQYQVMTTPTRKKNLLEKILGVKKDGI